MPIVESDEETEYELNRSRSRSPPAPRGREESPVLEENLTPTSAKMAKLIGTVVDRKLAPIKKNLNKLLESNSQIKESSTQTKGGVMELRRATATIEDQVKKIARADPKLNLTGVAKTKLKESVFKNLKEGKKKEDLISAVFEELHGRALVSPADEDSVKSIAAGDLKHMKSYLRGCIKEDLLMGNYLGMPKSVDYLKTHLKIQEVDESTRQFLVIMGLCTVKFENTKEIPMTDGDQANQEAIDKSLDDYWEWCNLKYKKYLDTGYSVEGKLRSIMERFGYEKKESNRPGVSRKST